MDEQWYRRIDEQANPVADKLPHLQVPHEGFDWPSEGVGLFKLHAALTSLCLGVRLVKALSEVSAWPAPPHRGTPGPLPGPCLTTPPHRG